MAMAIILFLCFIAMICIELCLEGLIIWGVGSFIVWVFGINFTFTFLHGLAIALIVIALKTILGGSKSD